MIVRRLAENMGLLFFLCLGGLHFAGWILVGAGLYFLRTGRFISFRLRPNALGRWRSRELPPRPPSRREDFEVEVDNRPKIRRDGAVQLVVGVGLTALFYWWLWDYWNIVDWEARKGLLVWHVVIGFLAFYFGSVN